MKKIINNNITWLDIRKPNQKDLDRLKTDFNLHPFIAEQFLPPIHRPKIEEFPGQLFIVLHFPVYKKNSNQTRLIELDLIITPTTLITSHTGTIPDLETFFIRCQEGEYNQNQYFKSSGYLLFELLDWLIDSCLPSLDHISEKIEKIEEKVFKGHEREMLTEIAMVKKDLIDFNRAIKPQRSVLEILRKKSHRVFTKELDSMAQEVSGSISRVWNVLENNRELINAIEQTNNSLLSHKLNDIMKFLTVVSFITFPLSVIVGFFGMNIFGNIPIIQNSFTWIIIFAFMILTIIVMVIYFRNKKWL
ncbi:magnesium transporter CorA family protein [Patescibacteria group bacterium]|nr:magnesium transporter CorA family protein [Patescibacteria group bacterium]MBU1563804.1 magnesium transporter CorA family protein [Patescibacteria group bacterium]